LADEWHEVQSWVHTFLKPAIYRISEMKRVVVYSDGACGGNPGPGGWAAILTYGKANREISGGCPATTNNRMELEAAVQALMALKQPCLVDFYTDSKYLKNGVTKWVEAWRKRGWVTNGNRPVKNEDQWKRLDLARSCHRVNWHWIQGHACSAENRNCDRLARLEIAKIKRSLTQAQLNAMLQDFCNKQFKICRRIDGMNPDFDALGGLDILSGA
jgi:ribonuclease HI